MSPAIALTRLPRRDDRRSCRCSSERSQSICSHRHVNPMEVTQKNWKGMSKKAKRMDCLVVVRPFSVEEAAPTPLPLSGDVPGRRCVTKSYQHCRADQPPRATSVHCSLGHLMSPAPSLGRWCVIRHGPERPRCYTLLRKILALVHHTVVVLLSLPTTHACSR